MSTIALTKELVWPGLKILGRGYLRNLEAMLLPKNPYIQSAAAGFNAGMTWGELEKLYDQYLRNLEIKAAEAWDERARYYENTPHAAYLRMIGYNPMPVLTLNLTANEIAELRRLAPEAIPITPYPVVTATRPLSLQNPYMGLPDPSIRLSNPSGPRVMRATFNTSSVEDEESNSESSDEPASSEAVPPETASPGDSLPAETDTPETGKESEGVDIEEEGSEEQTGELVGEGSGEQVDKKNLRERLGDGVERLGNRIKGKGSDSNGSKGNKPKKPKKLGKKIAIGTIGTLAALGALDEITDNKASKAVGRTLFGFPISGAKGVVNGAIEGIVGVDNDSTTVYNPRTLRNVRVPKTWKQGDPYPDDLQNAGITAAPNDSIDFTRSTPLPQVPDTLKLSPYVGMSVNDY